MPLYKSVNCFKKYYQLMHGLLPQLIMKFIFDEHYQKNKKSIAAFLKHYFIKNKRSKGLIPKFYFLKIECMHLKFEHYYFGSKIFKLVHETQKTKNKRSSWLVIVQWDLVCLFCVCYFLFLCDYQSIFYYLFFPPVEYVVR